MKKMPGYELIGEEERNIVAEIFNKNNGVLFGHGFDGLRSRYFVKEFENDLSEFFSNSSVVSTSSGTSAIFCSLKALDVKEGDEIITQGFNFAATAEAIIACNAKVVIADIDDNLFLSPSSLLKKISDKTKAVILVHMLGKGGNIYEIKKICRKNNIKLIEDNCESFGAKLDDRLLGTIGDAGAFSFDHGKTITTGEGGAVITENSEIKDFVKAFRDHGHENKPLIPRNIDKALFAGFNFRITEMQAAVGIAQLKKVPSLIESSKKRYDILQNKLQNKFKIRESSGSGEYISNFDTIMFLDLKIDEIKKITNILKDNGFGTKNIPDAMRWHCSYFWDHMLDDNAIESSKNTLLKLNSSIAIPILINRELVDYEKLAYELYDV